MNKKQDKESHHKDGTFLRPPKKQQPRAAIMEYEHHAGL